MAGSDLDIVLQLLFRDNKSNKSIDIPGRRHATTSWSFGARCLGRHELKKQKSLDYRNKL